MLRVTTAGLDGEALDLYIDRTQLDMRLAASVRARTWSQPVGEYGCPECRGIGYECAAHDGHHVAAESYIVEVITDRRPADRGEVGDVVITDLDGFCVPLIRYRTGDRAAVIGETCVCGRGLLRIGQIQKSGEPVGVVSGEGDMCVAASAMSTVATVRPDRMSVP